MPTPYDSRSNDNPSTYFVQDRKNKKELTRLMMQDKKLTAAMGGILPEQPDPTVFHRVLDVGCATGGWLIEAAQTYPTMSLVGIDISQRMIEHACIQAKAHQVNDRVDFHVMDVLHVLEFPVAFFDLVNVRYSMSYLRTWDWPKILRELLRVTCPGGIVRVTESAVVPQSNSSALTQLFEMLQCALFRAGHLFTDASTGLTSQLTQLLDQYGYEQVQTKVYAIESRAGTIEGQAFYENLMLFFQTIRPFLQKWGNVPNDYEVIYQQALKEMQQPDFLAVGNILTVWGSKPRPKLQHL
ncbi:MAG TPA: methyltransferase domain-containing protein [Ktedonobacteraceae bacterium]|nr:methyltransferase domain-containing protein [Ktedonobacteraceae bacterium]